ncbi:DUF2239 family protein [Sphingomonas lycopersici]|uniref:DUF2239 family protein n=1 Tax=Sphingomonas lycopersici TaxID=2951807 RepID=A0AA41Z8U3_9SPHN|nr:DUF2239 family protein [Sphingomonas lycopersici]MCW6536077.1 DUF2239 family protein [Sphingomonas lycopersici]
MSDYLSTPCTAFAGTKRITSGTLIDVALTIKRAGAGMQNAVLTFDDASGAVIDLDLRGTTAEIVKRLTEHGELGALAASARGERTGASSRSRGRPRLGVVAREVTLLPRHWEWLARQPGGASQMLRRLVDEARRADGGQTDRKEARERAYNFLSALAGDLAGYEEAIRALFAGEDETFAERMATWPADIRDYALALARPNLSEERS